MTTLDPLFPGMLFDAASRFGQDHADGAAIAGNPAGELGWACTLVPENLGGVGGNMADLASIVEGLAVHGVQLPVIERCAVVPLLLQAAPVDVAQRWLEPLCDGSAAIAPLTALAAPLDMDAIGAVTARQLDIGFELTGRVDGVDVTQAATHWVVPAVLHGGEPALFVVDAERMPAPATTYRTMEGRRAADFVLDALTLPAGACIVRGDAARAALARADDAALLMTAVDTVAALGTLMARTIAYLNERRQFGVALASFQALRHRLADMHVRYLAARGLLVSAFNDYTASADDAARTLRLMKLSLAETARTCAEAAIQMHGGMGMSEEVQATRMAQRLLASEFRYGDRLLHAARLLAPAQSSTISSTNHNTTRSAR